MDDKTEKIETFNLQKYYIEFDENELTLLQAAMKTLKPLVQLPATPRAMKDLFKKVKEKLDKPEKQRIVTLQ